MNILQATGTICVTCFVVGALLEFTKIGRPFTGYVSDSKEKTLQGRLGFLFALMSIFGLGFCMYLGAKEALFFLDSSDEESAEFIAKNVIATFMTGISTGYIMDCISASGEAKARRGL